MRRLMAWMPACLLLAACAVSPYQHEVNSTCGQYMPTNQACFNCGGLVIIELPFIGLCEGSYFLQHELGPAPARSIRDGIYAAPSGAFTVQAPDSLPFATYKADQASIHGLSYLSFMPTAAAAPAYTIAVMRYHPKPVGDEPREGSVPGSLGAGVLGLSYSTFGEVRRLRVPLPTTLDGQDARLGIYADFDYNSRAAAYFLVYSMSGSDAQATLSISWSGDCVRCKEGTEAEILAGVPGAERFLKSFHLIPPDTKAAP